MAADFLLYHLSYIGIALLLSLSLTYVWRANLFSLGHHGFFAIGAYSAVLAGKLLFPQDEGWFVASPSHRLLGLAALLGSLALGALTASTVAAVVGKLFSSIRGDYFAVATLIFAEVVNRTISSWGFVGGAMGTDVPYLVLTNSQAEYLPYVLFYAVLAIMLGAVLLFFALRTEKSVAGLWLNALRNDELAAEASGINVKATQLTTFIAAGGVAGLAGALFLHMTTLVTPADFSFVNGLPTVLYVVLGGLRPWRCVAATVLLYCTYQFIKAHGIGEISESADDFVSNWPEAIYGTILILSAIVPTTFHRWRSGVAQ